MTNTLLVFSTTYNEDRKFETTETQKQGCKTAGVLIGLPLNSQITILNIK